MDLTLVILGVNSVSLGLIAKNFKEIDNVEIYVCAQNGKNVSQQFLYELEKSKTFNVLYDRYGYEQAVKIDDFALFNDKEKVYSFLSKSTILVLYIDAAIEYDETFFDFVQDTIAKRVKKYIAPVIILRQRRTDIIGTENKLLRYYSPIPKGMYTNYRRYTLDSVTDKLYGRPFFRITDKKSCILIEKEGRWSIDPVLIQWSSSYKGDDFDKYILGVLQSLPDIELGSVHMKHYLLIKIKEAADIIIAITSYFAYRSNYYIVSDFIATDAGDYYFKALMEEVFRSLAFSKDHILQAESIGKRLKEFPISIFEYLPLMSTTDEKALFIKKMKSTLKFSDKGPLVFLEFHQPGFVILETFFKMIESDESF